VAHLKNLLRLPLAAVGGIVLGNLFALPFGFIIDWLFHAHTGGEWALTLPNFLYGSIIAILSGFFAGLLHPRRWLLTPIVMQFMPLTLVILYALAINRQFSPSGQQVVDMLRAWTWLGLLPAILGAYCSTLASKKAGSTAGVLAYVFGGVAVHGIVLLQMGGAFFHIFTVVVAYQASGAFAAVVTLFLPVISELYWAIRLWGTTAWLEGLFIVLFLSIVSIAILSLMSMGIGAWLTKVSERQEAESIAGGTKKGTGTFS